LPLVQAGVLAHPHQPGTEQVVQVAESGLLHARSMRAQCACPQNAGSVESPATGESLP
jgi:hypothetical protein